MLSHKQGLEPPLILLQAPLAGMWSVNIIPRGIWKEMKMELPMVISRTTYWLRLVVSLQMRHRPRCPHLNRARRETWGMRSTFLFLFFLQHLEKSLEFNSSTLVVVPKLWH